MRQIIAMALAVLVLTACESKHSQLRKEIERREKALTERQDSALGAADVHIREIDSLLQIVSEEYERRGQEAELAHAKGTGTMEQYERVNRLRQLRDSLQVAFDTECAKVRYIKKLKK